MAATTPYERYRTVFYKGMFGARWVFDRDHLVTTIGFNKGTVAFERGVWRKVKPGVQAMAMYGRDGADRELWCLGKNKMRVVSWNSLVRGAAGGRNEPILKGRESLWDFCVIDDVAIAVGSDGQVFRRSAPLSTRKASWQLVAKLEPAERLVAIDGTALDDVWIAGRWSVWHFDGSSWTDAKLPGRERATDLLCASKDEVFVCGGQTLVRWRRGKAERYEAPGCDFQTLALYRGELYLNSDADEPESIGIWKLRNKRLVRVDTGFSDGWEYQPCGQLHTSGGRLWSFGNFAAYFFDGKRWSHVPNPP